jgi:hypothetical protein
MMTTSQMKPVQPKVIGMLAMAFDEGLEFGDVFEVKPFV